MMDEIYWTVIDESPYSLAPPSPPSGSTLDHYIECSNVIRVYGKTNGDPAQIQFIAQPMRVTGPNAKLTAMAIRIGRYGTPDASLVIGVTRGYPPDNPFNPDTWDFYGAISPSMLPQANTLYWVQAVFPTPIDCSTQSPWAIAVTDADWTATAFWYWGVCNNIPSGENGLMVYGVAP